MDELDPVTFLFCFILLAFTLVFCLVFVFVFVFVFALIFLGGFFVLIFFGGGHIYYIWSALDKIFLFIKFFIYVGSIQCLIYWMYNPALCVLTKKCLKWYLTPLTSVIFLNIFYFFQRYFILFSKRYLYMYVNGRKSKYLCKWIKGKHKVECCFMCFLLKR
jgi:hypothetical protein